MRIAVLICVTACGRIGFGADVDPDAAIARDWGAWGAPVRIDPTATGLMDWEPAISPDGKTLVFTRVDATFTISDLFAVTRTGDMFGPAQKLSISNGTELGAAWSPDGTQLYLTSYQSGSPRLSTSDFDGTTFQAPVPLDGDLATEDAVSPALSANHLELYYSDDTMNKQKLRHAHRDTLASPWVVDGVIMELDDPGSTGWPTLSADGLALFFESTRDDPGGKIYVATRPSPADAFGQIEKVDPLDTGVASGDPDLSSDGTTMFFAQDTGSGEQDIYVATAL